MSWFEDLEDVPSGRGRNRGSSRSITVPPLVACQSVTITWTGQTPFHITVLDGSEDGAILEDFGETTASSTNWSVDRNARQVVFALSDASGETTFSDPQPIQPGPDCSPKSPDPDPMAQVFSSATTKYEAFSYPSTLSTSTVIDSSSSTIETSSSTSSSTITSSSITTSSSPSTKSSETPTTKIVQIITLTQTRSSTTPETPSGDIQSSTSLSSEDLVQSTALTSGLHQKEGSKTGIAVGITLGLGIPILLIFLAYYLHRRRSERTEGPYAKLADLHSRPQSSFTSRSASSIYSLRTDVMIARPPVPPIPASFQTQTQGDKRRSASASITSFGLPYEYGAGGREELSPFGDFQGLPAYGSGQMLTTLDGSDRAGNGLGRIGHQGEGSEMGDSVYGGIDGRR